MDALIEVTHVSKHYGPVRALSDVSLHMGRGEIVGVMGPNGSGKSTLISLVVGLARPQSGSVRVLGRDPLHHTTRAELGVCLQDIDFPATLTIFEILRFVAAHYASPIPTARLLDEFGLNDLRKRTPQKLSGGQRRRLAVACAFAGNPELVVLDEPSAGLDIEHRSLLWQGINAFADGGGSILITSHVPDEVQRLSRRVVLLSQGEVVADGPAAEAVRAIGSHRVAFAGTWPDGTSIPVENRATRDGQNITLTNHADSLVADLAQAGVDPRSITATPADLEDVILILAARSRQ
ncbi:ABC transporter ATP-binding protein [Luethyella okanaganae]|uniref:ABC transporter ATP-binding protein n=1 Tax=Luethyella okanaganae TaxID=69372 RepID=A0ABW1VIB7_9MICO